MTPVSMDSPRRRRHVHLAAATAIAVACAAASLDDPRAGDDQDAAPAGARTAAPLPVRNDIARAGTEILVLRHQQLKKGAHPDYYRASREGVWPWYEKIGTRIVGQWQVVNPTGAGAGLTPTGDDAYRLARYASFAHWQQTRDGENASLGGDGPDREKGRESGRERVGVQTGSKGAYFLEGETAVTRPLHMPGLAERYRRIDGAASASDDVVAVRNNAAEPGREVIELRYQRIAKGAFERFVKQTRDAIWPWEEKLGARPIGQWKVVYPAAPSRSRELPDADELVTMTRFASYAHWQAMRPERAVLMGGNGPDWHQWRAVVAAQAAVIRETSIEFLEGEMYHSPPVFMPGLGERYVPAR
ncbi:MAG: hypothetical protein ACT4QD_01810 [Acidobacteriota bacterium]